MHFQRKGFTLVELAIVIVIIGLLVGGVLQGQELIRQAQIRKDVKRITEVNAAIHIFYSKYNFIPGDYPETLARNSLNTAGGNGDSKINWNNAPMESYFFWRHLVLAKMLNVIASNGAYTTTTGDRYARFDESKGRLNNIMYGITGDLYSTIPSIAVSNLGNIITFAAHDGTNNVYWAAFTAERTRSIDEKLDDGKPTTGKLRGSHALNLQSGDVTSCNDGTNYTNEESRNVCRMLYEFGL